MFPVSAGEFFRRQAFENAGGLDPDLQCSFDYDLWIRLARMHPLYRLDQDLALSRMHRTNKTLALRQKVFDETFQILKRHYGYVPFASVYAYLCYRADGRDQFFEPFQPSTLRYLQSLPAGLAMNHAAAWKYFAEWWRVMNWGGFLRRISARGV
jgi:hypothetical protein